MFMLWVYIYIYFLLQLYLNVFYNHLLNTPTNTHRLSAAPCSISLAGPNRVSLCDNANKMYSFDDNGHRQS